MTDAPFGTPEVPVTVQSKPGITNPDWVGISGTVTCDGTPVRTMVPANGQHKFTCSEPSGTYDLEIPLDTNGETHLYPR